MALGTPTINTGTDGINYSASGGTSVSIPWPSLALGAAQNIGDGDCLVLIIGQKPSTANGGSVTTPSGWTLQTSLTGAGGYGATLGADTGNTNLFIYTKNTVLASDAGANLSVTVGTNNVSWGVMILVPAGTGALSYGASNGSDASAGNVSVTLAADPGFASADLTLWAMCIPTDVTTPAQFSAHAISATGASFASPVEIAEADSTTGNDIGGFMAYAAVTGGPSSAAATITATAGGTTTNVRGPLACLRIRETVSAATPRAFGVFVG
jgi:hypothetical protein